MRLIAVSIYLTIALLLLLLQATPYVSDAQPAGDAGTDDDARTHDTAPVSESPD